MLKNPVSVSLFFEGPPGESLFTKPVGWHGPHQKQDHLHLEAAKTQLSSFVESHDDRSLAIFGALLAEERVNVLLKEVLPAYDAISGFQASRRLAILRALQLIPNFIVVAAEAISEVRNKFAHKIDLSRFDNLPTATNDKLRPALKSFGSFSYDVDAQHSRDVFVNLVINTVTGLHAYRETLQGLRHHIYDSGKIEDKIGQSYASNNSAAISC
jgi:hypothetical protein